MENNEIQWHPPYIAAMNLEMRKEIDSSIIVNFGIKDWILKQ